MTAAVAPIPLLHEHHDSSALARKRRRDILSSQRGCVPDVSSSCTMVVPPVVELQSPKRRKISQEFSSDESDCSDSKPTQKVASKRGESSVAPKKPQMKYDPEVPMTKEEAAVWRREQRRKRNRESAAASRQRQRDRIAELEVELDDWKSKFEEIMTKLQQLEDVTQTTVTVDLMTDLDGSKTIVSPSCSRSHSPQQSPTASPISSLSFVDAGKLMEVSGQHIHTVDEDEYEEQSLNKMISRQAVKITGAAPLPLFPEDSMMLPAALCPDPCMSSTEMKMEHSETCIVPDSEVEVKEESLPTLLPDTEDEFGEFLLDAVTWL